MWANNEVGTVQPVRELATVAHEYGIPIHSDAVQAVGQLDVDYAASGLDALTFTGHKVGGPIGVGALLLGRKTTLTPVLHGGGQEREVRSGTLDAPAIAGLAAAGFGAPTNMDLLIGALAFAASLAMIFWSSARSYRYYGPSIEPRFPTPKS